MTSRDTAPPLPILCGGVPSVPNATTYPLFGRLLLEDVEALAGDARPPAIFLPVQLTLGPTPQRLPAVRW